MSLANLDSALVQAVIDAGLGIDLAHENLPYTPTTGTPYAEVRVLQNDLEAFSLSDSDETSGVLRVIVRYPLGQGAMAAKSKADDLFAAMPVGTQLSYGGDHLTIVRHSRQPGLAEQGWYVVIADIVYRAFLSR